MSWQFVRIDEHQVILSDGATEMSIGDSESARANWPDLAAQIHAFERATEFVELTPSGTVILRDGLGRIFDAGSPVKAACDYPSAAHNLRAALPHADRAAFDAGVDALYGR